MATSDTLDSKILEALQSGPIEGLDQVAERIQRNHQSTMMRLRRLNLADKVQWLPRGRIRSTVFYLPGQELQLAEFAEPERLTIEGRILQRLADGQWHESRDLRHWLRSHHSIQESSTYAALRALVVRGKVRKRFDGKDRGRRASVWSVQARAAARKQSRPQQAQPGYKVLTRSRIVDGAGLRPDPDQT